MTNHSNRMKLLQACAMGHTDLAEQLIQSRQVDINAADEHGTALGMAGYYGQTDTIKMLLKRGANINRKDAKGYTPLMIASAAGRKDIVLLLLNHGANPTLRTLKGHTAFDFAAEKNQQAICDILRPLTGSKDSHTPTDEDDEDNNGALKGFAAISGMHELKQIIQEDIIDCLNEPEVYREFQLSIPNGMLLYGPPGCGKTFFSRKFAEEINCPFRHFSPSDLASPFIHGTPKKIGKIFDEAKKLREEKNAKMIVLFFDEITTLFGNRSQMDSTQSHLREAVDAFLAELNNLGEESIFVVAATNEPLQIDPAILRAGRFDEKIYVGPPDYDARKGLFSFYVEKRPHRGEIDYDQLAAESENFTSADIKKVVDDASRKVILLNWDKNIMPEVTTAILLETLKEAVPSLTADVLAEHEKIRKEMEQRY